MYTWTFNYQITVFNAMWHFTPRPAICLLLRNFMTCRSSMLTSNHIKRMWHHLQVFDTMWHLTPRPPFAGCYGFHDVSVVNADIQSYRTNVTSSARVSSVWGDSCVNCNWSSPARWWSKNSTRRSLWRLNILQRQPRLAGRWTLLFLQLGLGLLFLKFDSVHF